MKLALKLLAATAAMMTQAGAVDARITTIVIERIEPFAPDTEFGAAGAYERVIGIARGELDPTRPENRGIVNLDKAPRNARGMVEYETDFFLLRPVDPTKGNRRVLYEVNNRGRKLLQLFLMDAQAPAALNDPRSAADAGNGLVLRMGFTLAWSGWDPEAPKANRGMTIRVPVATEAGAPIVRMIRDELVSGTRGAPVEIFRLSHEAAALDQAKARLTMRRHERDARVEIPPSGWAFADARSIRLLPEGTKPDPGALYEFHYPAKNPYVLGIAFAATRDFVAFLKYAARDDAGADNPAGPGITATLGVGISQSGRYLRDHIAQGFNRDESGRRVFDGVLAHISGIGRVFLNAEFGQPARTNTQHEDHFYPENEFPFAAASMIDPLTGKSGALLRGDGSDPLLIEVNTSTEYWQKGASLLHTDPLGEKDAALPATVRVYMVAGTQHAGRAGLTPAPGPCANPRNPHNPGPVLRALLVALDKWVTEGVPPPPSRVPTLAAGALVAPDATGFPALPGAVVARAANALTLYGDWVDPKPDPKRAYRALVSTVDSDGNETAGIILPDIAVPLATYAGWNLYKAPFPAGALCDRDGSYLPLAKTKEERAARNDPRPSLAERYASHDDYVRKVEAAAAALVRDRLLLPEDAARYADRARAANPLAP